LGASEWSLGDLSRKGALDDAFRDALCELTDLCARVCDTSAALLWLAPGGRELVRIGCGFEVSGEESAALEACAGAVGRGETYAGSAVSHQASGLPSHETPAWSFAAVPLDGPDNEPIGALCILDRGLDFLRPEQVAAVNAIARHVSGEVRRHAQFVVLQTEIAERTRTADELNSLFQLSIDMLCIAGFDGYFKRINPAWERTLGYTQQELLSRPYLDFVHPDDRESTLREAAKLSGGGNVIAFENRYVCPDGSFRWLAWAAASMTDQQLVCAAARDITERKLAEEDMQRYARDLEGARQMEAENASRLNQLVRELDAARARAERAARAKSEFLVGMTDEIAFAMENIRKSTELVLRSELNPDQIRHLGAVRDAAETLSNLTGNILDFTRIDAGQIDLDRVEFGLRDTIEAAVKSLALAAQEKGLELACEICPDVPDGVVGDPSRLRQIVLILVGNAIKFTDRGEVLLRVEQLAEGEDDAELHVAVSDTGIGIAAERHESVFIAFSQDGTGSGRKAGAGLGLALAARLVEAMKGRIWVESEPGKGSTFHLTARFELQKGAARRPVAKKSGDLRDVSILVADDNAATRRILAEVLCQWHMRVEAVESGAAALAALEQSARSGRPFTLALIDAVMPELNGIALAGKIRRDPLLAGVRILMLSPAGMQSGCDRLKEMGILDCLTKPVRQSELLDAAVRAVHSPAGGESGSSAASVPAPPDAAQAAAAEAARVFDRPATLDRLGGDGQLLRQLAGMFLEDSPRLLGRVRKALDLGDPKPLTHAVHTLKGAISNFVAPLSLEAAREVEAHVRQHDITAAADAFVALEREVSTLQLALSEFAPRRSRTRRPQT
jgi:PAS domain S-box-containing protein